MAGSYRIQLDADDSDLERSVDRASDRLDRLQDKASSIDIGAGSRSGSGTSRGGLSDPWAVQTQAHQNLMGARATGLTGDDLRPYQLASVRADAAAARADRAITGGPNALNARMFGHMGMGGFGGMGLRLSEALGPEFGAMLSQIALPLAGVALAAKGFDYGMSSIRDLGHAYWAGGGSVGETGSVSAIGRFLGRDPMQSAGAAVQFGEALHGGTFGAGYFRSRGIVDFGGLTVDKDKNYIEAVKALMNESDRGVATRVARDTGLTSELWMRDLRPWQRDMVLSGLADQSSPQERRAEADYNFTKSAVGSVWDKGWRGYVNSMNPTADFSMWDALNPFGAASKIGAHVIGAFGRLRGHNGPNAADNLRRLWSDFLGDDETSATPSLRTPMAVRVTPGAVGGDRHLQDALPAAAKNQQLTENLKGYAEYAGGYYAG